VKLARPALQTAAEAVVVALAITGDDDAFQELVGRRQKWLIDLMHRLCGERAQAEDLAQQAFIQAWRTIGALRSPAAFQGWLRQVAVNGWLQSARRGRLPLESLDDQDEAVFAAPNSEADGADDRMDLTRALALLKPGERLCVVLCYAEGLSHREIVEATGLPLGTVKSHVSRGAQRLRQALGDGHGR
jgi:RNA polymerase sigma factor (sigma-70 family)